MIYRHSSVMLGEVIKGLSIKPDGIYVDGTLGGGGHSLQIAQRLSAGGRLIGIDQDADAIAAAGDRLKIFEDRITLVHDNFENMPAILKELSVDAVDGILLDLGVSSYQLDNPERGFSYHTDAPLDMRMNRDNPLTAAEIINKYSEEELTRILRDFGEEKCAGRIAANIVRARAEKPLRTTAELAEIVYRSVPMKMRREGGNPCKRTFQAVRIACNRELDVLSGSLDAMIELLRDGGRLCVITFHSLEDRIVKNTFRRNESPCTCPPEFPVCVCGKKPKGTVLTPKPVLPSAEELSENSRAASAKLRIFERRIRNQGEK